MLRVGLTGELGSGKSTVAHMLAAHGAVVFSSDEMGRAMMQPGQPVFDAIVAHFGPGLLLPDGHLNRPELARLAFDPAHPRVEELNAIVHPAVLAEQEQQLSALARTQPGAIAVIESALIFSTRHAGGDQPWRKRFDRIILVTAPDKVKVERFVQRAAAGRNLSEKEQKRLSADAKARLAKQSNKSMGDYLIENNSGMDELERKVDALWQFLKRLKTSKLAPHN